MTSETPQYFIDFEKRLEYKFTLIHDKFENVDKEFLYMHKKFEEIDAKLDTHFEAIGELMIKTTGIETLLHKNRKDTLTMRGEMVDWKRRFLGR